MKLIRDVLKNSVVQLLYCISRWRHGAQTLIKQCLAGIEIWNYCRCLYKFRAYFYKYSQRNENLNLNILLIDYLLLQTESRYFRLKLELNIYILYFYAFKFSMQYFSAVPCHIKVTIHIWNHWRQIINFFTVCSISSVLKKENCSP